LVDWKSFPIYQHINKIEKYIDITKQIRDEVGVKVDIMFSKNNTGYVVIP